jgi:hypothetical protein
MPNDPSAALADEVRKLIERVENNDALLTAVDINPAHPLTVAELRARSRAQVGLLATNLHVASLNLGYQQHNVGASGAHSLASMLSRNRRITTLHPYHCSLDDIGASVLAACLPQPRMLSTLHVGFNNIGGVGVRLLCQSLCACSNLKALYLFGNAAGVRDGLSAIVELLQCNRTLTELNCDGCELNADGAAQIARALQSSSTLRSLSLMCNSIGDSGAESFASMLRINNTLERLDVSTCGIGENGVRALAMALDHNSSLIALNLQGNAHAISSERRRSIATCLARNKRKEAVLPASPPSSTSMIQAQPAASSSRRPIWPHLSRT